MFAARHPLRIRATKLIKLALIHITTFSVAETYTRLLNINLGLLEKPQNLSQPLNFRIMKRILDLVSLNLFTEPVKRRIITLREVSLAGKPTKSEFY